MDAPKRSIVAIFVFSFLLLIQPRVSKAQFAWHLIEHDKHDYIPLADVISFYQLQPDQIAGLDLLHAANTNTHHQEIRNLVYSGFEPKPMSLRLNSNVGMITINGIHFWLCLPIVWQNNQAYISRLDVAKTLEPTLRPQLLTGLAPFDTVVIDPGHGGVDNGAKSNLGSEKVYTLAVAQELKDILTQKGFKVIMTRDMDKNVSLQERAVIANQVQNPAIFVSLHFNVLPGHPSAEGIEVYAVTPQGVPSSGAKSVPAKGLIVNPGNSFEDESYALASSVQSSVTGHFPNKPDRGVRRARFVVLKLANMPGILVEGGYLSNPVDKYQIADPEWRRQLAESIADGIDSYHTMATTRTFPKTLADYTEDKPSGFTNEPSLAERGRMEDPDQALAKKLKRYLVMPIRTSCSP